MTSFETATAYNPRAGNGSAFDVMNMYTGQQGFGSTATPFQQTGAQIPFAGQQQVTPQQQWAQQGVWPQPPVWQQQPFLQQQIPYFQQGFAPGFYGQQAFQPFINPALAFQNPLLNPYAQVPYAQHAGLGMQQGIAPVVTHRSAELNIKIPVHRLIGRHPQEVYQYLLHVVLPVLLDGVAKRSLHPEIGRTVSTDLRGECVAEIAI